MVELATRDGVAAKALAFAILTAARSGEVRGMIWAEVDDAIASGPCRRGGARLERSTGCR